MDFKALRRKAGMTLEALAEKAHYSVAAVNGLENNGAGSKRLRARVFEVLNSAIHASLTASGSTETPAHTKSAEPQPPGKAPPPASRITVEWQEDAGNKLQATLEFQRIEHLRRAGNLTWEQVSKELELSVAMLMMLKSGKRKMSAKSLHRLAEVERRRGIESYESLPRTQLLERQADTKTGSIADFLRADELSRYIFSLEHDLENCRRMVTLAQGSAERIEDQLRLARLALAQKQQPQKNLPADVAGNIAAPQASPPPFTTEEIIEAADAAIAQAKAETEAARADAASARALLEEYERIDAEHDAEMDRLDKEAAEFDATHPPVIGIREVRRSDAA